MTINKYSEYLTSIRSWDGSQQKPVHYLEQLIVDNAGSFEIGDKNFIIEQLDDNANIYRIKKTLSGFSLISGETISLKEYLSTYSELNLSQCLDWLNLCFYGDEIIEYDSYYDTLPISDESSVKISDLLDKIKDSVKDIHLPSNSFICICGEELCISPLKYIIQQNNCKAISVSDSTGTQNNIEPAEEPCISFHCNNSIVKPQWDTEYPFYIYDSESMNQKLFRDIKLQDIIPDSNIRFQMKLKQTAIDYSMYKIMISGDIFGNEFLQVNSYDGKNKITIIQTDNFA